jgi:hypothetical protein
MLNRLFKLLTSLRLTVVCLGLGILLIWVGTVAQADEGLYAAQARYFKHWYVAGLTLFGYRVPLVLPGGYLLGTVLLVNLVAAHIKRFQWGWKKLGIHLTHAGIILLLVGQLTTDLLSRETQMRFSEGESRNYSESAQAAELVFLTDAAKPDEDQVVAIPESLLRKPGEIKHPKLPFTVRVQQFYVNARVRERGPMVDKGPPPATQGAGPRVVLTAVPETRAMDDRNVPSAIIELSGAPGASGTWVVSPFLDPQPFQAGNQSWRVAMRWTRSYYPFSVQLLKTTHEIYPGTGDPGIPKNFQSRVQLEHPAKGEKRPVDIYMNNPLRYEGLTFYQYQMGRDELDQNRGSSTLQVVRNPAWLTPYAGCIAVGGGLVIQFLIHLVGFINKRRHA